MIPILPIVFLGACAQTVYSNRQFFELYVADDGRIEGLINANDESWMTVYKQFIELDTNTGELMLAFGVGKSEYPSKTAIDEDAHIMTTTLASGDASWSEPANATQNADGYVHGNMVLWYDDMKNQMVMVYSSSRTSKSDSDDFDVHLTLVRRDSGEDDWSSDQEFFSDIDSPHVCYQFIGSWTLNDDGFSNELIIPVSTLAASDDDDNYNYMDNFESVVRLDRNLDADADLNIQLMEENYHEGNGYYMASIVRVPSSNVIETELVAFLRDSEGYFLYRATSDDDGYTWTDPLVTAIPNPDQTAQAIYLHSDLLMLIYNPTQSMTSEPSPGDMYANAHHLAVALSADYGLTWQFSRMLEYAYDGMFNNPVGLQDPDCNNIFLTYSVLTDETNGCSMLEECDVLSQNTQSYIKFTIINEFWVMNDFDYEYDMDNCLWEIPNSLKTFSTSMLETDVSGTSLDLVVVLAVIVGVVLVFNSVFCIGNYCTKRGYKDLEASQETNDPRDYDTTR